MGDVEARSGPRAPDLALPRALPSLTSLRAFAAAAVLVFHLMLFGVLDLPASSIGYTGVGFFFVLSGFVLTWGTAPGTSARRFYRRRFARVYPSHLVTLLVALAFLLTIDPRPLRAAVLIPNVLLLQAWAFDPKVVYGMNGPAWSLSCEMAFYLAFPLLVTGLRRLRPRVRLLVATAYLGAVLALGVAFSWTDIWFHAPWARMAEFTLGMVVALAVRDGWRPRGGLVPYLLLTLAALGVLAKTGAIHPVTQVLLAPPFALLIAAAAVNDIRGRSGLLGHRGLTYAGEVSFAFYLVHELVIRHLPDRPSTGVPAAMVVLAVSVISAVLLHHLVERPAQRWISTGRRARRPAAVTSAPEVDAATP
ncbi:acyltransferase family protein [Luteipulveratus flavus]|uniref:Acyltransferase n=1 Tax=Luteipulveratus flavus TaxID=3031728 RepID=A0ABT6C331_9MICO|nr:acyltransferase [Luteipulveratus sp. YIM 133296]MDF8263354.1 acyltransferase [Luteipulveratus sp. YIM 133296]